MEPDNGASASPPPPPSPPPIGSVAQETARLLEALLGAPTMDPTVEPTVGHEQERRPHVPPSAAEAPGPADAPCPTCGHTEPATHLGPDDAGSVCRVCPVCQVLRVVRSVRPETLDRLADLAAAVTETLRDAAAHRWGETTSATTAPPGRRPAPDVHDITVSGDHDDGDDHLDTDHDDADDAIDMDVDDDLTGLDGTTEEGR